MANESNAVNDEYIDVEEYGKSGKQPPKGKKYLIKIDKALYKVDTDSLTGREILQMASKVPIERYQLNQKMHSGAVKKIAYDEIIDFTALGIERFMTIPLDQTEG